MKLTIVSGRSGSGKSITLNILEDLGYYCVDNIPLPLIPNLISELSQNHNYVAISLDARNLPNDLSGLKDFVSEFKQQGHICDILYLDADDSILLQRYSETRRKHPLTNEQTSLGEAINKELDILTPIANMADLSLDTSNLSRHQLVNIIRDRATIGYENDLSLLIQSFGFKHGIPPDADFVFDVRCLPNPYWQSDLRASTGLDSEVSNYLVKQPDVQRMLADIQRFLENWIPRFEADNRSYVSIAIGCTGGQHRSVYIAEKISNYAQEKHTLVQVRHRDLQVAEKVT